MPNRKPLFILVAAAGSLVLSACGPQPTPIVQTVVVEKTVETV